jgi:uncharacterized protein (TIGR03086 family)
MTTNLQSDIRELNIEAVRRSIAIAAAVTPDHLDLPTPCAGWTVGDLLAHMTAQHLGFAAAAEGKQTRLADWEPLELSADPAADYAEAAESALLAFSDDGVLYGSFWLPEILDGGPFPAQLAIGFHFLDAVVHGWDLAVSLGMKVDYPPELVGPALVAARLVPDCSLRTGPKAAFRPALPSNPDQSEMDQLLMALGRAPSWPYSA